MCQVLTPCCYCVYMYKGHGILPTEMDILHISSKKGKTEQFKLSFANPLDTKINVIASIEDVENSSAFRLLDENNSPVSSLSLHVDVMNDIEIPFEFTASSMNCQYNAAIHVTHAQNKDLVWKYPIKGIGEMVARDSGLFLVSKARNKVTKSTLVRLNDMSLSQNTKLSGLFSVELSLPKQYSLFALAIERATSIDIMNCTLNAEGEPLIELDIQFIPLRALKLTVDMIINKENGGRWIYPLQLEATEPEIDGNLLK